MILHEIKVHTHYPFILFITCWLCGAAGIASFQPKQKGVYEVAVTQGGHAIAGSPFKITINDQHVCSAHKVKVTGQLKDPVANKWNDVTLNIGEAGTCSPILIFFPFPLPP